MFPALVEIYPDRKARDHTENQHESLLEGRLLGGRGGPQLNAKMHVKMCMPYVSESVRANWLKVRCDMSAGR